MIFSELESTFEIMQADPEVADHVKLKIGAQYIICTLNYQSTCSVDLKLISAQYPAFTVAGRKWAPQLLKQVHFEIPYGLNERRLSLIACLKKLSVTTLSTEFIDDMLEIIGHEFRETRRSLFRSFQTVLSHQPFQHLENNQVKLYGLKEKEIRAIQSITLEDILEHFSGPAEKVYGNEMEKFLAGTSNIKAKSMFIFYTKQTQSNPELLGLPMLIEKWAKTYSEKQIKSYDLMANNVIFRFDILDRNTRNFANIQLVRNQMLEFNMRRDPVILPNDTTIKTPGSCLKPIIFINIDISLTQMETMLTHLDKDRQVVQKQNIECHMQPLNNFITQSELYQRQTLCITNRLKLGLEINFGDYLKMYSNYKRQNLMRRMLVNPTSKLLNRAFRNVRNRHTLSNYDRIKSSQNRPKEIRSLFASFNPNLLEQLTVNLEMDDFYTLKDEFCGAGSELFTTCHPGYIFFFMITYLHCLHKQIEKKLESNVGTNWRANNIWYGISIDKNLLDTVFGSIKNLEQLFLASGILGKDDKLRKAKFCTRGEEILPAIQQKLVNLKFRMKSFFIVAQMSSKHIQLSLHQVVKLSASGEDAASIVIHDKIIHIDDVLDSLCKNIMKNMQVNCPFDYCTTHKNEEDAQYDFQSFETFRNIYENLKSCVVELLKKNKANLDMNSKLQLDISIKCGCSINIFLRDIIEVGLTPVIENMAIDIVASLTNKELFGNYAPNYVFVFGDPFSLTYGSMIHTVYTMIMQKTIDDGVHFKELNTKTSVLKESIFQLLNSSVPKKRPYMFERFITGTLCQVPSKTYALRILCNEPGMSYPFIRISSNGDIKNTIAGDGSYFVFIQKGKPLSTKGFRIHINEKLDGSPILDVLQLDSSSSNVSEKYTLLRYDTPGQHFIIHYDFESPLVRKIVIEYEHISDHLSIKISNGYMVGIKNYFRHPHYQSENIIEPLTLAYI
ncbi:uncharacterized protein EV154DRAFT_102827 [Mucor mucedo]|uniref:uncharacterized protein n=1 Tax=Mucor mucedo TaxID=29922 RepID=UPI0022202A1B|nr:uncharacterized protein EV154DRAFT_102827 [Mucor mucedo]KAI7873145.1 hypothetical protein EV154DRAFT_102827 [Mucor mucedo]